MIVNHLDTDLNCRFPGDRSIYEHHLLVRKVCVCARVGVRTTITDRSSLFRHGFRCQCREGNPNFTQWGIDDVCVDFGNYFMYK